MHCKHYILFFTNQNHNNMELDRNGAGEVLPTSKNMSILLSRIESLENYALSNIADMNNLQNKIEEQESQINFLSYMAH